VAARQEFRGDRLIEPNKMGRYFEGPGGKDKRWNQKTITREPDKKEKKP